MHVSAFFYGSYMDPEVLRKFGADPGVGVAARLAGHRLAFTPHANLLPASDGGVHGFVYELTHDELDRLYGPNGFVTTYRPVPVVVETDAGSRTAMTFVEEAPEAAPDAGYLEAFLAICRRLGLPQDHVAAVERAAGVAAPA